MNHRYKWLVPINNTDMNNTLFFQIQPEQKEYADIK